MTRYPGFRIADVHAIVAIGGDDEEGVPAVCVAGQLMPLLAANPERLSAIKQMAQEVADRTGQAFKIVRFSVREDIGQIIPGGIS